MVVLVPERVGQLLHDVATGDAEAGEVRAPDGSRAASSACPSVRAPPSRRTGGRRRGSGSRHGAGGGIGVRTAEPGPADVPERAARCRRPQEGAQRSRVRCATRPSCRASRCSRASISTVAAIEFGAAVEERLAVTDRLQPRSTERHRELPSESRRRREVPRSLPRGCDAANSWQRRVKEGVDESVGAIRRPIRQDAVAIRRAHAAIRRAIRPCHRAIRRVPRRLRRGRLRPQGELEGLTRPVADARRARAGPARRRGRSSRMLGSVRSGGGRRCRTTLRATEGAGQVAGFLRHEVPTDREAGGGNQMPILRSLRRRCASRRVVLGRRSA